MQRLSFLLFAVILFSTASAYSQVIIDTSLNNSERMHEIATHQNSATKSNILVKSKEASPLETEEMSLSMIRVHSAAETKPLKSGSYIWNGKQWKVIDAFIIALTKGIA